MWVQRDSWSLPWEDAARRHHLWTGKKEGLKIDIWGQVLFRAVVLNLFNKCYNPLMQFLTVW